MQSAPGLLCLTKSTKTSLREKINAKKQKQKNLN